MIKKSAEKSKARLTQRQKNFLLNFILYRNVVEAGVVSGFPREKAFMLGIEILKTRGATEFLNETAKIIDEAVGNVAKSGLDRIVTARVNDAVALAFSEDTITMQEIGGLNLDCVAEIKRPKGGGCEIKFFDRLKAVESVYDMNNSAKSEDTAQSFFNAFNVSKSSISNLETEDNE